VCFFFAEEMDVNRNGKVNLKKFLFAMVRWAGLETEDDDGTGNEASP
jgi:calcium-binding protein CML